jgi:hypothetical protein
MLNARMGTRTIEKNAMDELILCNMDNKGGGGGEELKTSLSALL